MRVVVGHGLGPAEPVGLPKTAVPAGFSFRRQTSGVTSRSKLSKWDVADIRRWVRTDGYGLSPTQQAEALHAEFPLIKARTIYDVILNSSFYDPTYDPSIPLNLPTQLPPEYLGWFLSLLLMWRSLCFVTGGAASVPVVLTRSK
jgi:hypothetical protein